MSWNILLYRNLQVTGVTTVDFCIVLGKIPTECVMYNNTLFVIEPRVMFTQIVYDSDYHLRYLHLGLPRGKYVTWQTMSHVQIPFIALGLELPQSLAPTRKNTKKASVHIWECSRASNPARLGRLPLSSFFEWRARTRQLQFLVPRISSLHSARFRHNMLFVIFFFFFGRGRMWVSSLDS